MERMSANICFLENDSDHELINYTVYFWTVLLSKDKRWDLNISVMNVFIYL